MFSYCGVRSEAGNWWVLSLPFRIGNISLECFLTQLLAQLGRGYSGHGFDNFSSNGTFPNRPVLFPKWISLYLSNRITCLQILLLLKVEIRYSVIASLWEVKNEMFQRCIKCSERKVGWPDRASSCPPDSHARRARPHSKCLHHWHRNSAGSSKQALEPEAPGMLLPCLSWAGQFSALVLYCTREILFPVISLPNTDYPPSKVTAGDNHSHCTISMPLKVHKDLSWTQGSSPSGEMLHLVLNFHNVAGYWLPSQILQCLLSQCHLDC